MVAFSSRTAIAASMSGRLKRNIKIFALLGLSIVLGTYASELIHDRLENLHVRVEIGEAAAESHRAPPASQTVKLDGS